MDPRAGTPAQPSDLVDLDALVSAYYDREPDLDDPAQRVVFGTSGHRGSALDSAFNEAHIVAITAAIVEYRRGQGTDGPLFIGRDTHALSEPAFRSALEVLAAAGVEVHVDARDSWTPTPGVSHAILRHNGAGSSEGVGVHESRASTCTSTPAAASTSRAERKAGSDSAWVSRPMNRGPSVPCPRRYSTIAAVIATMCASLNAESSADPRWPLVPNTTRCAGSSRSGSRS